MIHPVDQSLRSLLSTVVAYATSVCCLSLHAQSQEAIEPRTNHLTVRAAQSAMVLRAADPLTDADLELYSRWLGLSEAQCAFSRLIYEHYRSDCDALIRRSLPEILQYAEDVASAQKAANYDDQAVLVTGLFFEAQKQLEQGLQRLDAKLLNELVPVLNETQLGEMPRINMHRQRARSVQWDRAILSARIDLADLVRSLALPEHVLNAADPLLLEYEAALTSLVVQLDRNRYDRAMKLVRITNEFQAGRIPDMLPSIEQILAAPSALQRRIAALNRDYVDRLVQELPEQYADAVQKSFYQMAYPKVFPDLTDPAGLFEEMMRSDLIGEDLHNELQQKWIAYRAVYDSLCHSMMRYFDEWQEHFARTRTLATKKYEPYQIRMRSLRGERWDRNLRFTNDIELLFTPNLQAEFRAKFAQYRQKLQGFRDRGENDSYPGP
jgi:hypothetical protein